LTNRSFFVDSQWTTVATLAHFRAFCARGALQRCFFARLKRRFGVSLSLE
jgi:hypothetical protein